MNDTLSTMLFILVLGAIGLLVLIFLFGPVPANAVECRSHAGDTRESHWTWRNIDGRRCWYKGRRALPKTSLHWSSKKEMDPRVPAKKTAPAYRAQVVDPRELNEIDKLAPPVSGPIIMFPELTDKLDALTRWWHDRWKP